jgi:hypothetical protein
MRQNIVAALSFLLVGAGAIAFVANLPEAHTPEKTARAEFNQICRTLYRDTLDAYRCEADAMLRWTIEEQNGSASVKRVLADMFPSPRELEARRNEVRYP